jgi:hypothetical protein
MHQTAAATPDTIKQVTESVWQLGVYVALTLGFFAFLGYLIHRKLVPQWIKGMDDRAVQDREREVWARQQVERAQVRLDETYDKIPGALAEIAQRMEQSNRMNQEAFAKLFDQNARILERLPQR